MWKIFQLFELVLSKHITISDLFRKNFSIASSVLVSRIKEFSKNFDVIIDVGANEGQFALSARRHFPDSKIISFEPDSVIFQRLQKNVSRYKRIKAYNYALGNSMETLPFYRNEDSQTSSILPRIPDQFNKLKSDIITVDVRRLDSFLQAYDKRQKVLLKLDVQGYEKVVLEGCGDLLGQIEFILLEVSFKKFYQKEASFEELHQLLKNNGYQVVAPLNFLNEGISIIQLDLLYHKRIQILDQ